MKLLSFSRTRRMHVLSAAAALACAAGLVGCQSDHAPTASSDWSGSSSSAMASSDMSSSSSNDIKTEPKAPVSPMPMGGTNVMYYPTGDRSSSVLLLEKTGAGTMRVGKEYSYQIKVTNLTNSPLQGVTIQEALPGSFVLSQGSGTALDHSAMDHSGMAGGEKMSMTPRGYTLGELGPRQSRSVTITGTPSQAGPISSCMSVSYNPTLCTTAMVTNPQLKLTKTIVGSPSGDLCEPQTFRYTLTNSGTGNITGARVDDVLPAGITTSDGGSRVSFSAGNIAEGQSRSFDVKIKPQRVGEYASAATATADDGITAKSESASLAIKAPKLEVTVKAPEKEFLGQAVQYEVTVKNVGNAAARNPVVRIDSAGEYANAEGAQMASAREGGQQIGELAPGASKTVTVRYNTRTEGDMKVNAIASDPCAEAAMASAMTRVSGIPALLLAMVDDHDPIRIGENVTYTITVLNQGFGSDKDIKIVAMIPDGEQYVSSTGSTPASVDGQKITFAPVTTLTAKQTVNWTITVKATKAADVLFRVDMTSDSFPNTATKTEPTRLYSTN